MTEAKPPVIHQLTETEAVQRIVNTVQLADVGEAPFALVLGSGFSHGLVPTTKELIEESLPLWLEARRAGINLLEFKKRLSPEAQKSTVIGFWKKFAEDNSRPELKLELNGEGLPSNHAAAYRAVFNKGSVGALSDLGLARKFQRDLMRLDQPRLNAAHFLLASLLGVQPAKQRKNQLFKANAAFSRLILTTNFDPFLQTALQSVNRLYLMSDTPELGLGDEIQTDQTDAIHLVYLHGSVHRRSQAASEDDIARLKNKNASYLAPVLEKHGVIVIGYSGWDDVIVEALASCKQFEYGLYWLGLETNPQAKGAYGERVPEILAKPSAFYVRIKGAGRFMNHLCKQLVDGSPRLIANPIAQLREMLDAVDIQELQEKRNTAPAASKDVQISDGLTIHESFMLAKQAASECLKKFETKYLAEMNVQTRLANARFVLKLEKYQECLQHCDEGLKCQGTETQIVRDLLLVRGVALYYLKQLVEAIAAFSQLIDLQDASIEPLANALFNRGYVWGELGEPIKELADYSQLIDLQDAPIEPLAKALYNRGYVWGKQGEQQKAMADYTRLIGLEDAPIKLLAKALYNRGIVWGDQGEQQKAMADYTRLIGLEDAPIGLVAKAYANRAWENYERKAFPEFLIDTQAALNKSPNLAPAEFNLGLALLANGQDTEALAAYDRAGKKYPGEIEATGLSDLEAAKTKWLAPERAEPVIHLLHSLKSGSQGCAGANK